MIDFIVLHEENDSATRQAVDNINSYRKSPYGGGSVVSLKATNTNGALASFWVSETPEQIDRLIHMAQGGFLPVIADKWSVDIVAELIHALKINKDGIRDAIQEALK